MLRAALLILVVLLTIAWSCAAIWIDGPASRIAAGIIAAGLVAATIAAFVVLRPMRRAFAVYSILFAAVLVWWLSLSPSNDRMWISDVSELPSVEIDGDRATVKNVRNFEYRSETDFTEHWDTRSYDLSKIRGIDFFLSYWGSPHIAHTIVSWDFGDGKPLAISIETRKEVGESYSAILGFFRQYELYYVVADERDLVGVRTNHRGELVRRYRLHTPPDVARAILLDYFEEINRLATEPRWYNALTDNCTTSIRQHAQHVAAGNPFNWRILVNGHLDELGYMRGAIDNDLPFEEMRRRADITERAQQAGSSADFSVRIREPLQER